MPSRDFTSEDLFSSRMMSMQSSTHSSQMNTVGPAMSLRTSCWLLPQNEQYRVFFESPPPTLLIPLSVALRRSARPTFYLAAATLKNRSMAVTLFLTPFPRILTKHASRGTIKISLTITGPGRWAFSGLFRLLTRQRLGFCRSRFLRPAFDDLVHQAAIPG